MTTPQHREDYQARIAQHERAIATEPDCRTHYWQLGLAWLLLGNLEMAQEVWFTAFGRCAPELLETATTELLELLQQAAMHQFKQGRYLLTELITQQILELDEQNFGAVELLGDAIAQQGRLEEAIACWQFVATVQPEQLAVYYKQAEVWERLSNWQEAIALYGTLLNHAPEADRPDIQQRIGCCLGQMGRWEEALSYLMGRFPQAPAHALVSKAEGERPKLLGNRAYTLLQLGNLEGAMAELHQAAKLRPDFVKACLDLATHSPTEKGQRNGFFLRSLQQPDSAKTYQYLGDLLKQKHNHQLAALAYQIALQKQPDDGESYLKLGQALRSLKQLEAAKIACQTHLRISSNSARGYLELGRVTAALEDFEEALQFFQNALDIDSNLLEAILEMGNICFARQQWNDAIARYRYVLEQSDNQVEVWVKIGVALAEVGEVGEAIAAFKKTLEINSNLAPDIWKMMQRLLHQNKLQTTPLFHTVLPIDTPTNYWETTESWVASNPNQGEYRKVFPAEVLYLTPPKTPDGTIHFSFRFGDRVMLPESFVATIPNGRFWIDVDQSSSAVFTEDNHLLSDLSPEFPVLSPGHPDKQPNKHWTFLAGKLAPAQLIEGKVALFAGLSNNVYFHWMFDIFPRLELLRQSGFDFGAIDYFLINHQLPFQQESLEKFAIPPHKLLQVETHSHIQASQFIVPSFPGTIAWMSKWVCEFLRTTFLNGESRRESREKVTSRRLYISRHRTATRRVINESEVVALLTQNGFTVVSLESLAIAEQAELFASAEIIIAPHGSGLTNLVFCQPGTKIIELFSPNFVYSCYWLVSSLMNLEYRYLIGDLPLGKFMHQLLYSNPRIEDIFVNLEALSDLLKTN